MATTAPIYRTGKATVTLAIDSLADTSSGDGISNHTETLGVFSPFGWQTVAARFIVEPSIVTDSGVGLSDSCVLHLLRKHWGAYSVIAVDTATSLPCTLTSILSSTGDTSLLIGDWFIDIEVSDTCSTHTLSVPYQLKWEYEAIQIQ